MKHWVLRGLEGKWGLGTAPTQALFHPDVCLTSQALLPLDPTVPGMGSRGLDKVPPQVLPRLKILGFQGCLDLRHAIRLGPSGASIMLSQGWNLRIDLVPSKFHAIVRSLVWGVGGVGGVVS